MIENTKQKIDAKPFVKWAGGKKQLLNEIKNYYPFTKNVDKYCEPFVGAGAVLFDILNNYDLKKIYISDINTELINTYKIIQTNVESLILELGELQDTYVRSSMEVRKKIFYDKRTLFNKLKQSSGDEVTRASLFIFLNKTGFNGLYRENSSGEFNVPIGSYKNPKILDERNLKIVNMKLKNVIIKNESYEECISFVDPKTFVYFDPPYRPLSSSSKFTSYNKSNFNDMDQINLANFYKKLDAKGAYLLLSNSDPKNSNENDDFFDELYRDFDIKRVKASRYINSNKNLRGQINELLISNKGVIGNERFQQLVFDI